MSRVGLFCLALTTTFALPASALAYCRTMDCKTADNSEAPPCTRDPDTDCQVNDRPLFWSSSCLSFGVQKNGSPKWGIAYETAHQVAVDAFATWLSVDCGSGKHPSVQVSDYGSITCNTREYNDSQPNANVIMFRDDRWPYKNSLDTLGLTTLTFNTKSGEIFDADIEINSFEAELTVDEKNPYYDLPSILTHEVGHFFGLAHSNVTGATMQPGYMPGETTLRTPHPDDVAGICSIYPPDRELPAANCDPRHGFSRDCAETSQGCSYVAPRAGSAAQGPLFLAALSLLWAARRRRRL